MDDLSPAAGKEKKIASLAQEASLYPAESSLQSDHWWPVIKRYGLTSRWQHTVARNGVCGKPRWLHIHEVDATRSRVLVVVQSG